MATRISQRGFAGTAAECTAEPLAVLSRPLLIKEPKEDRPAKVEWTKFQDFAALPAAVTSLIRSKRVFGVGGLQLVIDCGLVVDWYNDDATRRDALNLIEDRGARPLLDMLADRDSSASIFGKNDLRDFFKTFPAVSRANSHKRAGEPATARSIRLEHPLRLRKVLEFLFLTEAVLRFRFRENETKTRFENVTGRKVKSLDDAEALWGYMWAEPLFYVIDPPPRDADIGRIMSPLRKGAFAQRSGQQEDVLHWALRGVPSTFLTADAAAEACNDFYGMEAAKTYPVLVPPDRHDLRLSLIKDDGANSEFLTRIEDIVRLKP